jgi:hypothetical protein
VKRNAFTIIELLAVVVINDFIFLEYTHEIQTKNQITRRVNVDCPSQRFICRLVALRNMRVLLSNPNSWTDMHRYRIRQYDCCVPEGGS